MATISTSDVSFISKIIYPYGMDPKTLVRGKPLLSSIGHKKDFSSAQGIAIATPYTTPQGASATAATASTNAGPASGSQFLVTQVEYFVNLDIAGQVVYNALRGDGDSQFIDQMRYTMDTAQETMGSELNRQAYASNSGSRGTISAASGSSITLTNYTDAVNFEPGMVLVAADTETGAILSGTPGYTTVTKVNISGTTATLTVDGTVTTQITSISSGDHLFRQGDAINNGTAVCPAGLSSWVPTSVASNDSFFGVNRSFYRSRLAGVYYDGSSDPLRLVLINAVARARMEVGSMFGDGNGDVFVNPRNFANFQASIEGSRLITEEGPYGFGIEKLQVGSHKLVADAQCPINTAYLVPKGSFERASCGDMPTWNNLDGSDMWLDRSTNKYKAQLYNLGNFVAPKVQQIVRIALPSA